MSLVVPEPAGDIRAQLRAVNDPEHPKRACFVVPDDRVWVSLRMGLEAADRVEGTLVAKKGDDVFLSFSAAPSEPEAEFDRAMAEIMGYPEPKPDVLLACQGRLFKLARVVQARTMEDWVIHEAMTSPAMLGHTTEVLQKHVPPDGRLCVLRPIDVIRRRLLLREAGK